jgi:SWI/SNF-related matrix-associated actin-dependent regulator 1 of chromatin subfamily A
MISMKHLQGWQTLVLDEAHRCGNFQSKRAKMAIKLMKATPRVYALTGTPIPRYPYNLWPLLHGLGIYKNDFMTFAKRYCGLWMSPWGWDWTRATNLPELKEKIKPHVLRHTKAEVFKNYQPPQFSLITFDLPVSRKEQDFDAEALVVNPNLVLAIEGLSELLLESARRKVASCVEFISDLVDAGEPVVVFAIHKEIVSALEDGLRIYGVVKVVGDTSSKERDKAIDAFQNGEANVIIGNVAAMSEGVNLARADTIVFVETGWSPAALNQSSSRVENLQKQSKPMIYILTTANSLDHRVIKTLMKKQSIIDAII